MNLGNIAEPKHRSDKVNREVTTDHPNLPQSVPTDDNLNNLNGNDSGMTSPVVVESISTQSSLMLMMSRKTKRHQPQESASTNNINGPDTKTILEEEITHLKAKLTHSERLLKSKDSHICKMDSETILLKKELATNRSYTIKLEQDIVDLETLLKIQKQKNKINSQEGSLNGTHHNKQYENIKTLLLEQRIKIISSSPSVGDDLIESDYNYRTDEVPVAQTNRNDNNFLEKQGQRKHVRIKEPNIPTNRKRSMQTNVHKPIKKTMVSQPPPQIHTGLQAPMMHLPYQSLVTQQNNMVKLPPGYPQMFALSHPMIRHAIYPRHYTQPMNVLQQLQTRN
jgi:hypothetical protein